MVFLSMEFDDQTHPQRRFLHPLGREVHAVLFRALVDQVHLGMEKICRKLPWEK